MNNMLILVGAVIAVVNLIQIVHTNYLLHLSKSQHRDYDTLGTVIGWSASGILKIIAPFAPRTIVIRTTGVEKAGWLLLWRLRLAAASVNLVLIPLLLLYAAAHYVNNINVGVDQELVFFTKLTLGLMVCLLTIVNTVLSLNVVFSWLAVARGLRVKRRRSCT